MVGRYEVKNKYTVTSLELKGNNFTILYYGLGHNYAQKEGGEWSIKNGKLNLISNSMDNENFGIYLSGNNRVYEFKQELNSCIPTFVNDNNSIVKRVYLPDNVKSDDTSDLKLSVKNIDFDYGKLTAHIENTSQFPVEILLLF